MNNKLLLWIKQRWRLLAVLLVPLVLLPLPVVNNSSEARCGYIVLILTIFWIFEVIPLPVTSLLPLILFPMAGILKAEDVAPLYFKDIIALFFGSLSFAYAVESVNLHRRIALFVLSRVGTSTKWAMAGLMVVTAFLSMWINNSAAASIMLPVALAISDELSGNRREDHGRHEITTEVVFIVNEEHGLNGMGIPNGHKKEVLRNAFEVVEPITQTTVEVKDCCGFSCCARPQTEAIEPHARQSIEIKKAFLLATAYSATIGGLSSLVGTAPNVFVKGFVDTKYKGTAFRINFANYLFYGLPVAVLMLIFCWLWLQIFYNRKELFQCRVDPELRQVQCNLKAMLMRQYNALGKSSWSEYTVAIIFIVMILLWLTKDFGDSRGWDIIFQTDYISDGTVAVFCGMLPLILPNSNPFKSNWTYKPIVSWKNLVKNVAWGAIFLLGAGLSVAAAFTASQLSESVAHALRFLAGVPHVAVILLVIIISGLFTEVTSNLSTASIFFPVLDSVARSNGMHPAFLILPCALAVSLAFMLPIATPPNAIVFASGDIRVIDMVKTGVVMNIIGFLVLLLAATTWMPKIYGLDDEATDLFYSILNQTTTVTTTPRC